MQTLEEEASLIREFKEANEVDEEAGGLVPGLGCTRTRNSIFFRTVELYWHTKTLVALGLLPKVEDFKQLKGHIEALEIQNAYIMEILSWMANLRLLLPKGMLLTHWLLVIIDERGFGFSFSFCLCYSNIYKIDMVRQKYEHVQNPDSYFTVFKTHEQLIGLVSP